MSHDATTKPTVIAVVGPTATGKTGLSIALAKHLGTEIISADSRLVYRGLDIGTAKPTLAERDGIPHHLIDVVPSTEVFTVADYQALAKQALDDVIAQGNVPIVVGGTGFYLRALLAAPNHIANVVPNAAFRADMQALYQQQGQAVLYNRLMACDPVRAKQLYPQDVTRVIRALEINHVTGQPVPQTDIHTLDSPYNVVWLGLTYTDRAHHRAVIRQRVEEMLARGWRDEVACLAAAHGPNAHALHITHGYPELLATLPVEGAAAPAYCIEAVTVDIAQQVAQYARRQRTWFKKLPAIHWQQVDNQDETENTRLANALAWIQHNK